MSHHLTLKDQLTMPILARLMAQRYLGWAMLSAAGLQGTLVSLGLPGWPCLFRHTVGLPCPGCGLSRAAVALFQGEWELALTYHAFVPFVLLGLALMASVILLPDKPRHRLIDLVASVEQRLAPVPIGLMAMLIYWLVRLLIFPDTYLPLILS